MFEKVCDCVGGMCVRFVDFVLLTPLPSPVPTRRTAPLTWIASRLCPGPPPAKRLELPYLPAGLCTLSCLLCGTIAAVLLSPSLQL